MINLLIENVITDLRKSGIKLSDNAFDAINEYIDIQNSTAQKIDIETYRDLKDKEAVIVAYGSNVIAIYSNNKFIYNPQKIKISEAPNFDVYEIIVGGTNVQNRRQQRRDDRAGLVSARDSKYSNVPSSVDFIWDKDWNPDVNREYYMKKLAQKHAPEYAKSLEDAYDVVVDMIEQRKSRRTGKRTEYNRMILDIVKQVTKIEDELIAVERNFSINTDKLEKEFRKLPHLVKKAQDFMGQEREEEKRFGKPKPYEYDKIEK